MIKIGDRVKINHKCVKEYWDITGTVKKILPVKRHDPLINYVEFDAPLGKLEGEYFADKELDKIES